MRLLLTGVFCLILSACWQQDEVISIESDGEMKWLIIAKPDWDFTSPDSVSWDLETYASKMRDAGWSVETKGTVTQKQDVVIGLLGNLNKVNKKTDFYKIYSIREGVVKIEFLCPIVEESRIRRSIKIKGSRGTRILCEQGVQTIRY